MNNKQLTITTLILFLFLFMPACDHDSFLTLEENNDIRNIGDYIGNNFDLTLFYAALQKTGVIEDITGDDIVTVFAPSNAAFNALGVYRESDFDEMNIDSLTFMLKYHILNKAIVKNDIAIQSIDTRYPNLAGKDLIIAKDNSDYNPLLYVNGVRTPYSDIMLSNGVLHIIDAGLKYREGTVQDLLSGKSEYSVFSAALKKFGYWERLAEAGPWTIVAPNDSAFKKAEIDLDSIARMDPTQFKKRFMGGYLLNTHLFISDLGIMFGFKRMYPYHAGENIMIPIDGDEEVTSGLILGSSKYINGSHIYGGSVFLQKAYSTSQALKEIPLSPDNKINYVTDNGVVHDVEELLVLPNEAMIDEIN